MTISAQTNITVKDQIQTIIKKAPNENLSKTMSKIQMFVLGSLDENTAKKAIFDYVDLGTRKKFSAVLKQPMNPIATQEYKNYEKLVTAFLTGLKSNRSYDVIFHFNEIVTAATGQMGVIQAANCANFAALG